MEPSYQYDVKQMQALLEPAIREAVTGKEYAWLRQQQQRFENDKQISFFNLTFSAVPRFIKRSLVQPGENTRAALQDTRKGFRIDGWSADRLVRSWWLLQLPAENRDQYLRHTERLFQAAEMHEQVALYGALPLLAYPEQFRLRAAEGIRTSMDVVFEAAALDNPYPSEYLDEPAWNQLVLKAFFMNKPVNRIIGIDARANQKLAYILSDYAHERRAAGRPVNPLLWRPVGRFITADILSDIRELFDSGDDREKEAAALACSQSDYPPAGKALDRFPDLRSRIEKGALTWESLG